MLLVLTYARYIPIKDESLDLAHQSIVTCVAGGAVIARISRNSL